MGLGWLIVPLRGQTNPVLCHNGGTGGFRSFAAIAKERDIAVIVLASSARPADAIRIRILRAIVERH